MSPYFEERSKTMGIFDASTSASRNISTAQGTSQSSSSGYSMNYPIAANANAAAAAELAFQRQKELNQMTMDFNSKEAEKQRNWEANMANSIYTRSVKNMREAGINPVLAAGMGLSGASVSSGATASFGGSSAPLAQTFMGAESANSSQSTSQNSSYGKGWSNSESGLATFLEAMGGWVNGAIEALSSSKQINIALGTLEDWATDQKENYDYSKNDWNSSDDLNGVERVTRFIKGLFGGRGQSRETRDKIKNGEMDPHSGAGHKF